VSENGSHRIVLNNNGIIKTFHREEFDINIYFFVKDFLELDSQKKIIILSNLFQLLYDLWKYAEHHKQDMTKSRSIPVNNFFDLYSLYESIQHFIQRVFLEEKNIRDWIVARLLEMKMNTEDSTLYPEKNYTYFENTPNQYNISNFFCTLGECDFSDLDTILDVGTYLSKIDSMYLYEYLYTKFDVLIDLGNDDELVCYDDLVEDFIEKMEEPYEPNITKKEKLFNLFMEANYTIQDDFDLALTYRLRRYRGEEISKSEDEEIRCLILV
jgi:hypothetical protein